MYTHHIAICKTTFSGFTKNTNNDNFKKLYLFIYMWFEFFLHLDPDLHKTSPANTIILNHIIRLGVLSLYLTNSWCGHEIHILFHNEIFIFSHNYYTVL